MNTNERLEKLVERPAALTQTIEWMSIENRERDAKWSEQFSLVNTKFLALAEMLEKLSRVAEAHEHRLDDLEGA
jgi:hypothetical protein